MSLLDGTGEDLVNSTFIVMGLNFIIMGLINHHTS